MYAWTLRPLLFLLPPGAAHTLAFAALGPVERLWPLRALVHAMLAPARDPRLLVRAMGLDFPSPLGLAAGFDKEARRPRALAALGFGHLELGTVTAQAQAAREAPNLFRLPADRALINRLGFPNEGAEQVARRLGKVRAGIGVPVGMSIGKSRAVPVDDLDAIVQDYVASFEAVRGVADFVVVNVSSPNTAGLRAMQGREHAEALFGALTEKNVDRPVPLLVKIAPDLDDAGIEEVLSVVESIGLAGVVATNTTVARDGLATAAARVQAIGAGGLSGPPIRARALDVVRRIRARLGETITVVGVGGVERADHVVEYLRAGADLVQMYTGFVYEGPGAPGHIAGQLVAMMDRSGVGSIREIKASPIE